MTMGERTGYGRSHDRDISLNPDFEQFDEEAVQPTARVSRFARSPSDARHPEESMPMFLSGYDDEQGGEPLHYAAEHWPARERRTPLSSRILLAVVAAAAVAVLFALMTSDATRDLVASAKASIIGAPSDPTAPPQPTDTQLTARDMQLNEPVRLPPTAQPAMAPPVQTASIAPSREEIANAYQTALQNHVAVEPTITQPAVPPAGEARAITAPSSITSPGAATAIVAPAFVTPALNAPPPQQQQPERRMDRDELAGIINRAKSLLMAGDIPPARLLLERAADAQEAAAALMLAQTYDARVLGTKDVRNINADPTAARNWYRRAAQLGSAEAQRRLDQLQN
jgi:hypothetical protein